VDEATEARPVGRRRIGLGWQLGAVTALALAAVAVPPARMPLLVATNWVAVALIVAGVRRYRPARTAPWVAMVALTGFVAAGNTVVAVTGGDGPVARALTMAAQAMALFVVPAMFRGGALAGTASRYRWADTAIVAVAVGLVVLQVFLVALEGRALRDAPWVLVMAPCIDVVVVGFLLRLALSRTGMVPAMLLGTVGAFGTIVFDLVVTLAGQRVALPGQAVQALGVMNMLAFGVAAMHPSMTRFGTPAASSGMRQGSTQVLALLPAAVVPYVLWALQAADLAPPMPLPVLTIASAVVATLALLRAVGTLRDSETQADRDPLTDLLNRRGLARAHAALAAAPAAAGRLAVVDLDDFKQVNDGHGHEAGDALIVAVADRLRAAVGERGVVARPGGDEFAVLLHGDVEAAEVLRTVFAEPFAVDGRTVPVRASAGLVDLGSSASLDQLLVDADIAMYAAKRRGGGLTLMYRPQLREEILGDFTQQQELRALLGGADERDVGRLEVYFQSIVELSTGAVAGAEALVRWQHPVRGLVAPDRFLDLAEQAGLGPALDLEVLRTALRHRADWGAHDLGLSVNLGLGSMRSATLTADVLAAVREHGADPTTLRLEITEHSELPDDPVTTGTFRDLSAAGVRLSLDDFGVGYSALGYLQRYPVTLLKLDRSLVGDGSPASLLDGIAALAHTIDLPLLAEGVETADQLPGLRRLGVRYGQGYLFSRPLPAQDFAAYLQEHRPAARV
jgi:diguanylate cyclase (GGDEF)-like protein